MKVLTSRWFGCENRILKGIGNFNCKLQWFLCYFVTSMISLLLQWVAMMGYACKKRSVVGVCVYVHIFLPTFIYILQVYMWPFWWSLPWFSNFLLDHLIVFIFKNKTLNNSCFIDYYRKQFYTLKICINNVNFISKSIKNILVAWQSTIVFKDYFCPQHKTGLWKWWVAAFIVTESLQ